MGTALAIVFIPTHIPLEPLYKKLQIRVETHPSPQIPVVPTLAVRVARRKYATCAKLAVPEGVRLSADAPPRNIIPIAFVPCPIVNPRRREMQM